MDTDRDTVSERTPGLPIDLGELGDRLCEEARTSSNGRAALTLNPHPSGEGGSKQTLVAVRAGTEVGPQGWNAPPSVQVLQGTLHVTGVEETLGAGSWTKLTDEDARLTAEDDVVMLLVFEAPK